SPVDGDERRRHEGRLTTREGRGQSCIAFRGRLRLSTLSDYSSVSSAARVGRPRMDGSLKNKTMIVTGASSGIGRAVARRLGAEGVKPGFAARSAKKLRWLRNPPGPDCTASPWVLTKPADIATMVKATTDRFGPIDILFANAGSYVAGKVAEGDPEEWDRV